MSVRNDGRADGEGRVYQAGGDQHITEHHHHAGMAEPSSPDSVRWPPVGRAPVVLRDRGEVMARLRAAVAPGVGGGAYVLHGLGGCGKTAVAYEVFRHATSAGGRVGLCGSTPRTRRRCGPACWRWRPTGARATAN
ncbi:ATP-binding protein [Streptomyces sp. 8K308]|uniref:ATP-binding protein n=1 Tax=Streptomyces sp. 8K308 TaxID=2530388 RepID=UPI001A9DC071|nr:ATP-binding protein [Streptomyces sp. 8K308]